MTENITRPLSTQAMEFFQDRGIDPELASHFEIYSASHVRSGDGSWAEPKPDINGNIIVFPYFDRGREVNAKFRWEVNGQKRFMQRPNGKKTFWNADFMDDEILHRGDQMLIITEGEIDALSAVQSGHPWAISCPDGAPPDKDQHGNVLPMRPDKDLDPANDPKYAYILKNWAGRLDRIKKIILATDADGPGMRLRDELARRIGRVRCYHLVYPSDEVVGDINEHGDEINRPCKDLNEVLVHFGRERVLEVIQAARPMPVHGLYTLDDFEEQTRVLYSAGMGETFDEHIQLYEGAFRIVSGLPGTGKTAVWLQIAYNAAAIHGWPCALASFEADVKPDIQRALRHFHIKKPRVQWTSQDIKTADDFIREMFCFITRDPNGRRSEPATVDWFCDRVEDAIIRFGVKQCVLDPWNKLDHSRKPGERGDEYLGRALTGVLDLATRCRIDTTIIAHPTKDAAKTTKDGNVMSLYDISDGAHWSNAAQQGLIVHRKSQKEILTEIYVRKIKFRGTGKVGDFLMHYEDSEERFVFSCKGGDHADRAGEGRHGTAQGYRSR